MKKEQSRMPEDGAMNMTVAVHAPTKGIETLQEEGCRQEMVIKHRTDNVQEMDGERETNGEQQEDILVSLFERWDKDDDGATENSNNDRNDDSWEQTLKDAPSCERYRCYNCIGGKCVLLSDADFGHRGCPFYKPFEMVRREQRASLLAMLEAGRYDLVKKYRKQYAALDVVEIGDLEMEKMFYSLRVIEEDLQRRQRKERERLREESTDKETMENDQGNQENTGRLYSFFSDDALADNGTVREGNKVDDTAKDWPVRSGIRLDDTARELPVEDGPWVDCHAEAQTEAELFGGED